MKLPDRYDGPRLLRPDEELASHRLSQACFGVFAGEGPDETPSEDGNPESQLLPNEEIYVIACEGVPVSQISIFHTPLHVYGSAVNVGSIGGVCTLPEERGNGLATVLLEHCAKRLIELGSTLMFISGGRGLYTRAGCVPAGCHAAFTIKAQAAASQMGSGSITLRPAVGADALAAARLYQAEPVHFERALDSFYEHFDRPSSGWDAEKWIVERDARPVAYMMLNMPWEYATRPEAGVRFVHEYAGSRAALAEAAVQVVRQGGLSELTFIAAGQDSELIDLLERRVGSPTWMPLPDHTERILDFSALMDGLRAYQAARLPARLLDGLTFSQSGGVIINGEPGADPGRCVMARGADRLELDTAAMTRLVMGDPEGLLAVDAPGALREIAAALFPLPAFMPGLDYH